jgi:hypothetical protein
MCKARFSVLIPVFLAILTATANAEYSPWSFGGGLNLIYNSDNTNLVASGSDPGGYTSAPSPIAGYIEVEYRYPLSKSVCFAPSASLFAVQYLWDDNSQRALPAEIENRTAWVPSLFLDLSVLYHFEKDHFSFAFGGGPAVVLRYGFLESGVSADEKYDYEDLTASEQVKAINSYLWQYGRWLYPTVQAGVRYELETGWGAGLTLRAGIPISNLWSSPSVPFIDSFMFMASIVVTPPVRKLPSAAPTAAQVEGGDAGQAGQESSLDGPIGGAAASGKP